MTSVRLLSDEDLRRVPPSGDEPGFGSIETARGHLPLTALAVEACIDALVVETTVTQTFVNALDEPLEATYIFPLPDRAAVTRFRIQVKDRVIDAVLRERADARLAYDTALRAGHRAAIAEEERAGVFTIRAGNLMPGDEATVRLTLVGPLPFADGEATYRFPLVVAPRYIPGTPLPGSPAGDGVAPDTDAVPDASRITPPVLLPGFRNPVRLALAVELRPGVRAAGAVRSSLHATIEDTHDGVRRIRVQPGERLDRDFVLRFQIGGEAVTTSLAVHPDTDGDGGTFLLTFVPPARSTASARGRDVVFVVDRSGSMRGWKMVTARRAVARMIDTLTSRDRFSVLAFDNAIETVPAFDGPGVVSATDRNRFRAVEWLAKIEGRGGTEMAQPLRLAVDLLRDGSRECDRVLVVLTDGQVGNEDQILRTIASGIEGLRIFTLGIDRAVNEGFLRRLAALGGGLSEVVESDDRLDEVMAAVHDRIGAPVLSRLRLEANGLAIDAESISPARLPSLFPGAPLFVHGRFRGSAAGGVIVRAEDEAGFAWSATVAAERAASEAARVLWARAHVRDLEDRYASGKGDRQALEKAIVATSLRFGVLSRFTAFVAVDSAEVVNAGGVVHRLLQPVEMPSGWEAADQALCSLLGAVNAVAQMPGSAGSEVRRLAEPRAMLGGLFSGRSGQPPAAPASPTPSRLHREFEPTAAYRRRASEILDELKRSGGNPVVERRRALGVAVKRLEALVDDLRSVGVSESVYAPLVQLLDEVRRTLERKPSDADVNTAWTRMVEALERFASEPERAARTPFWKS